MCVRILFLRPQHIKVASWNTGSSLRAKQKQERSPDITGDILTWIKKIRKRFKIQPQIF